MLSFPRGFSEKFSDKVDAQEMVESLSWEITSHELWISLLSDAGRFVWEPGRRSFVE